MLIKERTAIIFTANTPHLAHANLMLDSLRDKNKGNFQGDIWVISTGLSVRAKNYLDSIETKYLVNSLSAMEKWEGWEQIAENQSEYKNLLAKKSREESLKLSFETYRNKRLSKLIILDWFEKVGHAYDFIALCDNDLYFQKDVQELFDKYYDVVSDKIYYWHEENEILPGTSLWLKNHYYSCLHDGSCLDFGKNEINIGFIMGKPSVICQVFEDVQKSFYHLNIRLFAEYGWHDQDLVRLNKAQYPERYSLIQEGEIVHICNGGANVIKEKYQKEFYHIKTGEKPYIIHFAGGAWQYYDSIKATYMADPDLFYSEQEYKEEYDVIRRCSFQDLFHTISDQCTTLRSIISKSECRKNWINLADNGKYKVVIVGWKDMACAVREFSKNESYDIAILNGDASWDSYEKNRENLPVILTKYKTIISDPYLVSNYGLRLSNIPEEFYNDILEKIIGECLCTEREARTIANLMYLYVADAIDFYKPNVLCLEDPLELYGIIIESICKVKRIPVSSKELLATVFFQNINGRDEKCGGKVDCRKEASPLVSVIMPVYNAEEYLAACINSICGQTLTSLELICVNNGSTDDSQKILEYFAKRDSRIKLHYQEEANQRAARNWGYDHAKGKYLYLIDSDDYLDTNALELLVEAAERKKADVLYFFFREVRDCFEESLPRPRWFSYRRFFPKEKIFKMQESLYKFFIQYPFPWAKLIRRDLVLEKKLYFDLDCSNFDDNPHNLRVLFSASNVFVYNEQFYNFRIHNASMTQSKNPRILGMIDAVRIMNQIYQDFNCYDLYAKWYVPYKVHLIAWAWGLVPKELRETFYNHVKDLFYPEDDLSVENDNVWSYYEMPNQTCYELVKRMLSQTYEEFLKINGKEEKETVIKKGEKMAVFKVAIMGELPGKGYSGGRYHAWIMAEALAHAGNQVYVITNNSPEFRKDFECYPNHAKIEIVLTKNFYQIPLEVNGLDYVICVPSINRGKEFYFACWDYSVQTGARFAFINFETPNWFAECTDIVRPEGAYVILKNMCKKGCLIFSSAKESQKYAQEYYNKFPDSTEHRVWSPPINSIVADQVKEEKRDQVIIFLRIQDKHKGGEDFLELLGEYLRGMECVCVVGNGVIDSDFLEKAQSKAAKYKIKLRFEKKLTDYQKFQEIKKSKLLLFPSHFEGYGYPPVEALYCGTKCIVYDLPVLREVSGTELTYCDIGNLSQMREYAEKMLKEPAMEPVCVDTADFGKQALRIQDILTENFSSPRLLKHHSWIDKAGGRIRKWYNTENKKEKRAKKKRLIPQMIKNSIQSGTAVSQELTDNKEKWRLVKKQLKGKKVYIWGCGRAYESLYSRYKNRITIEGILDSDSDKVGAIDRVSDRMIIQDPKVLQKEDKDSTVVLISNKYGVDAIIMELEKMGVKYYHSLCMIEMNSMISKLYKCLVKCRKLRDRY